MIPPQIPAVELLTAELLAGGAVEGVVVAADVPMTTPPAVGVRPATDRIVGCRAPLPEAGVGVDRVQPAAPGTENWPSYNSTASSELYSPLSQINTLKVAR